MLDHYFVCPTTVDRIRSSWIGDAIERYVKWLHEQSYAARCVFIRVPLLQRFGEFSRSTGAKSLDHLADNVEPFIEYWLSRRGQVYASAETRRAAARVIRGPIQQFLRVTLPDCGNNNHAVHDPFADDAPDFLAFQRRERGLRETTLIQYRHYLQRFQNYLSKVGRPPLRDLSPAVVSAFIAESGCTLDKRSVQSLCSILKVFFRYLFSVGLSARDLSKVIESPRRYRLANVPRSIAWDEVEQVLQRVDRRSQVGKRDYAILLLLVTYGLRAREVAALTLDDVDWSRDRLCVHGRKAGHSSAYPLTPTVGAALLDYLQRGRPQMACRAVFSRARAPFTQLSGTAVSLRAKWYLRRAGVTVPHPGSHTLRHTCVQRLVDSGFSLKEIGDFVGHRTPDATNIYAKVNIEALREVALGDGEEVL
jgi:integrase/recombinase XerD